MFPDGQSIDQFSSEMGRRAVAEALGKIGNVSSIPSLIRALDDDKVEVRSSARTAIEQLTGKKDISYNPGDSPDKRKEKIALWQKWWETEDPLGIKVLIGRLTLFE